MNNLASFITRSNDMLQSLSHPLLLVFRLWVAKVFFLSGWQKINDWEMTLTLFEYEYNVPLLPYQFAAILATAGELLLPLFLLIGLATRYSAIALSLLNIVAVMSYYEALAKVGQIAPHQFWGAMLLVVVVFGPGLLSVDHWLKKRQS